MNGDRLQSIAGEPPTVISAESISAVANTYNLTVQDAHTFYAVAGETPVLVHNTEPFDVDTFGNLGRTSPQVFTNGTSFHRHELLQNGWLKYNGYTQSSIRSLNPSLAVSADLHRTVINVEQGLAGLHKPSFLAGMSAYDNIRGNIAVLKASGVDHSVIANLANQARNFAKTLPCP